LTRPRPGQTQGRGAETGQAGRPWWSALLLTAWGAAALRAGLAVASLFERLLDLRNDVGLFSEKYDPRPVAS